MLTHIIMGCQCDDVPAGEEPTRLEEERNRILARVDDLKHRVGELERQLQETKQEVDTHRQTRRGTSQSHLRTSSLGSFSFSHIGVLHFWPFGFSSNLMEPQRGREQG